MALAIFIDQEKLHKSQFIGLLVAAAALSMIGYASNAS
jgi:hypothetical protein